MDSTADVTAHAELDRLLAAPPVGALELHVADRHRRVPIGERLAEFAVDEVLFTVLGGEPGGGDETPRMATVGWAGARGALAGVAMAPSDMDAAAHRAVMIAARQRAIPVRYFVEDAQLVGSSVREIGVVGGRGRTPTLVDLRPKQGCSTSRVDSRLRSIGSTGPVSSDARSCGAGPSRRSSGWSWTITGS
ncbi:MAG: hypothetical protein R2710_06805 [Acidimicrobiales bacterium]